MKTLAVIGYILAVILVVIGLGVSLSEPTPIFLLAGIGVGVSLAFLSTIVLGIGQIRDAQRQTVQILLHVNGLEFRKTWLGTEEGLRVESVKLSAVELPAVGAEPKRPFFVVTS